MFFQKDPPGFYIETIQKEYKEKDPVFFDTSQFEWCAALEAKTPELLKELAPVCAADFAGLMTNPEDRFQFPPKIWKGFPFYFNGFKFEKNLKDYPLVAAELKKIPNLISASVSVLEPGSHLLPHNGNTNAIMRYHLGLNIPAPMPDCGFIISGNEVSWEVGKSFMFCNMNVHSAHNKTNKRRHILMLDIVRPEYVAIKRKICVHIIAKYLTNVTIDYLRKPFGVKPPRVDQDPNKEMVYEGNEGFKKGEKLTIAQRIFRKIDDNTLPLYIGLLSIFFFFKKMQ